jgi:hypothetical protein
MCVLMLGLVGRVVLLLLVLAAAVQQVQVQATRRVLYLLGHLGP